jgi:hypothetical protein
MATTIVKASFITDTIKLGEASSGVYFTTVHKGTPVFIGTDTVTGTGHTQRVCPITSASTQILAGIATMDHDHVVENKGIMPVALLPCLIRTTSVASGAEPAIGAKVYLLDDCTWSNADGSSSLKVYGTCIDINATDSTYLLNLTHHDDDTIS